MSIKRIGIVYMSNGNLVNTSKATALLYLLRKELESEGKILKTLTHNRATFDDGSMIQMDRLGNAFRGGRCTHYYIDDDILSLAGGIEMVEKVVKPLIISSDNDKYDLSGNQLQSYGYDNNIIIKNIV